MDDSSRKELLDLVKRMKNDDWSATALLVQAGAPAVELLIPYLDVGRVFPAAAVLVKIGEPSIEPLIRVLKSGSAGGQAAAAWALGQIRDRCAVGALVDALGKNDKNIQREAAWALGRIKDPTSIRPLLDFFMRCSEDAFEAAKYAVIALRPYMLESLITLLKDGSEQTRRRAISVIGWDDSVIDDLIEALQDSSIIVRSTVTRLLAFGKDKKAVDPLISALKDEDEYWAYLDPNWSEKYDARFEGIADDGKGLDVDTTGIEKLPSWYYEDIEDFIDDYLGRLIDQENAEISRLECQTISNELYGVDEEDDEFETCEDEFEDDYQEEPGYISSSPRIALVKMGEMAVEGLTSALTLVDESVRKHAAHALGELGAAKSAEHLIPLLDDESVAVRENTVWALGCILAKTRDSDALKVLIKSCIDIVASVRSEAALALGRIADPLAAESLLELLDDDDLLVRQSAIWALGKMGDDRAVEPLAKILKDENESLRLTAEEALVNIGSSSARSVIDLLNKDRQAEQKQWSTELEKDEEILL